MDWKILNKDSSLEHVNEDWIIESNIPPWRRPSIKRINADRTDAPPMSEKEKERSSQRRL